MDHLTINDYIEIPLKEFDISYARSGGPGGQNVNKVNSKVILRWAVRSSDTLPGPIQLRFLTKYKSKITLDGEVIVTSQKFRDQGRNFDDCMEKLRLMIVAVVAAPTPRRETKPSRAMKERRVEAKRETSVKKQQRQRPGMDD